MSGRRALVVGFGSIGQRHARLLAEAGCAVAVVSRHGAGAYPTLASGVAEHRPELVVVATETADHARVLDELAACSYGGRLAVEKPLFDGLRGFPWRGFGPTMVAYPLRCHPAIVALKRELAGQRVLSAQFYVGQYLPEWRPGRDYRECYSAHAAQGGGVLRDLSHELDLANWLLGPWRRLAARGGHVSTLEIDSDDVFAVLSEHANCSAATIQMNYLDRRARRSILLHTDAHSYAIDLIGHTLQRDAEPPQVFAIERDAMFRAMHAALLAGEMDGLCGVEDGLRVLDMVAAAERSAGSATWEEPSGDWP